jgi:sugar O-acyltransferase (sialic acid O-acetyltransferase NeuD family)
MSESILILGAGAYAEEVADYISLVDGWELVGFVEGLDRQRCERPLLGLPVYWIDEIGLLSASVRAVCAVGSPKREALIRKAAGQGIRFASLRHASAVISPSAVHGEGCILSPGAVIGARVKLGNHVLVNRGALLGHHVQVGDYCTIGPGANLGSKTRLGDSCYIGIGAVLVDGLTIGQGAFVSAGSLVTKDVPDYVQVIGSPAQVLRRLENPDGD